MARLINSVYSDHWTHYLVKQESLKNVFENMETKDLTWIFVTAIINYNYVTSSREAREIDILYPSVLVSYTFIM